MLDDFRQQAAETFGEEEDEFVRPTPASERRVSRLFGLTPFQMFVVALLLLAVTCLLSSFCLLVTGHVAPPFI